MLKPDSPAVDVGPDAAETAVPAVLGPTRMDYAVALRAVREAALALSEFVEELYGE